MEYQEIISKKNRTKTRHIAPSFGGWECHNVHSFPITQYLEEKYFFPEANSDLFQAPPTYIVHHHHHKKELDDKNNKQGKVWHFPEVTHQQQLKKERAKAVDEDLYEIPHELLYHDKPKRGMVANDFWRRCFGLSCIP